VLCASPDYLKRHGVPKTLADLARHNFIEYSGVSAQDLLSAGSAGRAGIAPLRLTGNMIVNHLEALRVVVLQGAAIALLGTEVVGDDIAAGRLVPLLVDILPPRELPIHVMYASRRHVSAKVRSFVDFLAERFANESLWPTLEQVRALAAS
jgi:DNA-binding transcriptional LysR family regulator